VCSWSAPPCERGGPPPPHTGPPRAATPCVSGLVRERCGCGDRRAQGRRGAGDGAALGVGVSLVRAARSGCVRLVCRGVGTRRGPRHCAPRRSPRTRRGAAHEPPSADQLHRRSLTTPSATRTSSQAATHTTPRGSLTSGPAHRAAEGRDCSCGEQATCERRTGPQTRAEGLG
jgi:hypothetical protein